MMVWNLMLIVWNSFTQYGATPCNAEFIVK